MLDHTHGQEAALQASEVSADAAKMLPELPLWEQPKLEEVSEQVMAQPYIRFT